MLFSFKSGMQYKYLPNNIDTVKVKDFIFNKPTPFSVKPPEHLWRLSCLHPELHLHSPARIEPMGAIKPRDQTSKALKPACVSHSHLDYGSPFSLSPHVHACDPLGDHIAAVTRSPGYKPSRDPKQTPSPAPKRAVSLMRRRSARRTLVVTGPGSSVMQTSRALC